MGYSLEFHSISLEELGNAFTRLSVDGFESLGVHPVDEVLQKLWLHCEYEFNQFVRKDLVVAESQVAVLSPDAAIFVSELIRLREDQIGRLEHASASGNLFRERFMKNRVTSFYKDQTIGERLLWRPMFGIRSGDIPFWGWLSRNEIWELISDFSPGGDDLEYDIAVWADSLQETLEKARERNLDLVTLYI